MIEAIVFALGAAVGSFLNVCIYRMPKKISIVRPRSHCPSCGKAIAWYDNIPLLSIILLRAKCRRCGARISLRYFAVELLTAGLFLLLYSHFGLTAEFCVYAAVAAALVTVSFIDLEIQEIPDEISIPGMALGVILCGVFPQLVSQDSRLFGMLYSALGLLVGGLSIYLMGAFGEALFRKEAMGGGDVKLMAMIGAFIGWKPVLLAFFIAPFFGSVVGIIAKIKHKEDIIPYGPYLSLGAMVALFWGDKILGLIIPY